MMVSGRDGSKIFDVSGIAVNSLPEDQPVCYRGVHGDEWR